MWFLALAKWIHSPCFIRSMNLRITQTYQAFTWPKMLRHEHSIPMPDMRLPHSVAFVQLKGAKTKNLFSTLAKSGLTYKWSQRARASQEGQAEHESQGCKNLALLLQMHRFLFLNSCTKRSWMCSMALKPADCSRILCAMAFIFTHVCQFLSANIFS